MSYEDVKMYAVDYFKSQEGVDVRTEVVTKADVVYDAVIVSKGTVGICLSVEALYENYKSNVDMESYFKSMLQELNNAVEVKFHSVVADVQDWTKCRGLIRSRVVNYERNVEYLQDKVYRRVLDLAIIYAITWADGDGCYSIVVTQKVLEDWGIAEESLDCVANQNMLEHEYVCLDIQDIMRKYVPSASLSVPTDADETMYVLTNTEKTFGAALMFVPGVLRECADRLGGVNLVIIPSSKHEVIILRDKVEPEDIRRMVCEVNETQVSSEDYLADNVYLYKYDEDTVVVY